MTHSGIRAGLLIVSFFLGVQAFCQTAGTITGNWKFELKDETLEMEVYLATDGTYYGKLINDNSNPTKNGTLILKKLKYNKESQKFKGTMRPHDANIELDVTVTAIDKDRLKMIAKKLLISKTMYLTRIK